jgi:hypothetical protein
MADTTVCAEPPRGASCKSDDALPAALISRARASSADDLFFPQAKVAAIASAATTEPAFCDPRIHPSHKTHSVP